ncbi:MAG: tyrosine-type recombinase/integrase [Anaerolineae bacterium]|nr:tyrosine-type recombinase/integrase [Anaerolineae bacterium]
MSNKAIVSTLPEPIRQARQATLDSLSSANSKRAYARDIDAYFSWAQARGLPPFNLATLESYKADLLKNSKSAHTVNRYLVSIRALLKKFGQLFPEAREQAEIASEVSNVKQFGQAVGTRLSLQEAQAIVDAPAKDTLAGLRDRALLAVLFGCLLRRQEIVDLHWSQLRQVDGHWCFVDIRGKGNRVRTVKVEAWVYRRLMEYAESAALDTNGEGCVFVRLGKGDRVIGEQITTQAVYRALKRYAPDISPHDARRTGAHLARKHGAPLEQIQHTLGHASIVTTERYTAMPIDLDNSATGYIGLSGR